LGQSGVNLGQIEGRSWSNILQIWVEYSRGKILVQSAQNVVEHSADLGGIFRRKILGKTRSGSRVEWAKIFPQIWAKILCGFCADFVPQIWAKICLRFGRRFGADLARILCLRFGPQIGPADLPDFAGQQIHRSARSADHFCGQRSGQRSPGRSWRRSYPADLRMPGDHETTTYRFLKRPRTRLMKRPRTPKTDAQKTLIRAIVSAVTNGFHGIPEARHEVQRSFSACIRE